MRPREEILMSLIATTHALWEENFTKPKNKNVIYIYIYFTRSKNKNVLCIYNSVVYNNYGGGFES